MSSPFTSLADRIVCINLKEREDRYLVCKQRFSAVGLKDEDVEFLRVDRHSRGGRYGCYDSHRRVMQQAYDDGLKSVLIFEDDVEFREGWEKMVEECKAFLELDLKFDAVMMGPVIKWVDEKTLPTVWRVKCVHAHAYVVSREGMRSFLAASSLFEAQINDHPQDVIQNSVWRNLYGHVGTSIAQDNNLGTDLVWIAEVPLKYIPWFQNTLVPAYDALLKPIIRSDWWSKSWLGSRCLLGLDCCVIDDGKTRLVGAWQVDCFFMFFIMISHKPPFGYANLLFDFQVHLFPALFKRIGWTLRQGHAGLLANKKL